MKTAFVIGSGPAGLMAAHELAKAGVDVTIADAKSSPARKFLMAGKSGLNLTKDEKLETFLTHIHGPEQLTKIVSDFGPTAVVDWANKLGQNVFTGTSGRVFPKVMKASSLLRAWLKELDSAGVKLNRNWKLTGIEKTRLNFQTPDGPTSVQPDIIILAMGGASWARLGSDGAWRAFLTEKNITCTDFAPANVGLQINWSDHMSRHFGTPVKPVRVTVGDHSLQGEFVVSSRGVEGSAIYAMSRGLREGKPLYLDLLPPFTLEKITEKLSQKRGKASLKDHLRKTLKLNTVKIALLQEFARPLPQAPSELAKLIKALELPHEGPRPLDEAISCAGGLAFEALDEGLMIKQLPGVFACGEMLDWEAPTGGYLLTTCLATGRHAGKSAVHWANLT